MAQIIWETKQNGVQEGVVLITIRHVIERLETEDETFYNDIEQVHAALQGFQGELFTKLNRKEEREDNDHDNCIVWEMDYETRLCDGAGDQDKDLVEATPTKLTITPKLDIDNDNIRTGDGDFS